MTARIIAAVICLLGGLLVATPGAAAPARHGLSLNHPLTVDGSAQLSGRAPGRRGVVLQKRLRHHRWKDIRRIKVHHGRYRTRVALTTERQVFRTQAGSSVSRSRVVAAQAPTDACGTLLRKPDGTYWSCTFVDDFNGTALDRTKWVPQTVFVTGDKLGPYACYDDDPSVVSVSGGALNLTVRKNATPQPCAGQLLSTPYRAGSVASYHLFSQQYGRFEARFRTTATTAPGLQESWWLWPDDRDPAAQLPWPLNGEIDIAETYSRYPDNAIPFLHYTAVDNGGAKPGLNTAWDCVAHRGVYNTYTLEWSASRLEILVNGKTCLVNTSGDSAFRKHYILELTQALGTGENKLTAATPLPATMSVDYVKVWQ